MLMDAQSPPPPSVQALWAASKLTCSRPEAIVSVARERRRAQHSEMQTKTHLDGFAGGAGRGGQAQDAELDVGLAQLCERQHHVVCGQRQKFNPVATK